MRSRDVIPAVFSRHAEAYRERLSRAVARGEAPGRARVVELLAVRPGDRVLDLGCGPGTLTLPLAGLAGPSGLVVGVDLADGMLSLARAGAPPWVAVARMDIERLALRDGAFDAAAAGHSLQFSSDLPATLAEARRVLRTGGRLAASFPAPDAGGSGWMVLHDALAGLLPPAPDLPDTGRTRELVRDLDRTRAALRDAGFEAVTAARVTELTSYGSPEELVGRTLSWWSFAWRMEALSEPERRRVHGRAVGALREQVPSWPLEVSGASWVVSARARAGSLLEG